MKKVLVVDDAKLMRHTIKRCLENNGFEVVGEATNGIEAIAMASLLSPDLITMDINMDEMDGICATRQIVKENPEIKICMVTSMGADCMVKEALEAGAREYIVKPFSENYITNTIMRM